MASKLIPAFDATVTACLPNANANPEWVEAVVFALSPKCLWLWWAVPKLWCTYHDHSWRPTNAHKSSALLKEGVAVFCLHAHFFSCSTLILGCGTVFALPCISVHSPSPLPQGSLPLLSHCMTSMLTMEGSLLLMCVGPLLFHPCHSLGCCALYYNSQKPCGCAAVCACLLTSCYVSTCGYEITSMINCTGFSDCPLMKYLRLHCFLISVEPHSLVINCQPFSMGGSPVINDLNPPA